MTYFLKNGTSLQRIIIYIDLESKEHLIMCQVSLEERCFLNALMHILAFNSV